jgi:ABC-type multidrug transport system ATPase subunit
VASLLEVGTGFHPELTGSENIYLNGAILGMGRKEIQRKFDEIVDFAEVERFLDTPVKRYSSGMYVRLAFAVAAHLEPEILIVDEVLAVGDAPFQKKCLGKMEEVGKQGRTVLIVSHNMAIIKELCKFTALLKSGKIQAFGQTDDVVQLYNKMEQSKSSITDLFSVSVEYEADTGLWEPDSFIKIIIKRGKYKVKCVFDLSFHTEERCKLFYTKGYNNESIYTMTDVSIIKIKNPGIVNTNIYVDIGIRLDAYGDYIVLEKDIMIIKTNKTIHNNYNNGIIIPDIY